MRENFNFNKRKREEAKKKKRDEKIARKLAQKNQPPASDTFVPDQTIPADLPPTEMPQ